MPSIKLHRSALTLICLIAAACESKDGPPESPDSGIEQSDAADGEDASSDDGGVDAGGEDAAPGDWRTIVRATPADDEVLDLEVLSDGTIAAAGYEGGNARERPYPAGNARAWLASYRPDGTLAWERIFDTPGADVLEAVAEIEAAGDLLAVGRTTGVLGENVSRGSYDVFAAIVDRSTETPEALLQFGTQRPQRPRRLARDGNGGLLIAGYDDVHVPTNYVESWEDPFVLRFILGEDSGRRTLGFDWFRSWQTDTPDYVLGLAFDPTRSATYLVGRAAGGPLSGAFAQRRDTKDNVIWTRLLSPISADAGAVVAVGADGDILVGGSTYAMLGAQAYGDQDAFLVKLRADTGEIVWATQAGSPSSDWVTDMAIDTRGHVFMAGETLGVLAPGAEFRGDHDVFVVEFDAMGRWIGAWQTGSAGDDSLSAVAVAPGGQVFVGGYSTGALAGGAPRGGRDAYLLRPEISPREP